MEKFDNRLLRKLNSTFSAKFRMYNVAICSERHVTIIYVFLSNFVGTWAYIYNVQCQLLWRSSNNERVLFDVMDFYCVCIVPERVTQ